MKKDQILVVLLITLLCCSIFLASCTSLGDPYAAERKNLASALGVKLSNYPQLGFPVNYFYEVLKPGMSSDEVHKIVIGYKTVFLCDGNREFYYYFSTDDDKADRFLVVYDSRGNLFYKMGEDTNSRELHNSVDDCKPGRFGIE